MEDRTDNSHDTIELFFEDDKMKEKTDNSTDTNRSDNSRIESLFALYHKETSQKVAEVRKIKFSEKKFGFLII